MSADSLRSFLDVDKALIVGMNLEELMLVPGFQEKFNEEIDEIVENATKYQSKLGDLEDSLDQNTTLGEFAEKAIESVEPEDRVDVAFIMGMYIAECNKTTESSE